MVKDINADKTPSPSKREQALQAARKIKSKSARAKAVDALKGGKRRNYKKV